MVRNAIWELTEEKSTVIHPHLRGPSTPREPPRGSRVRAGIGVPRQALRTLLGTRALTGTATRAHFLEWHCGLRASCPVWRPPSGTGRPVNAENHLIKHSREMPA